MANKNIRVALVGTESLRGKEIKNVLSRNQSFVRDLEFYDSHVEKEFSKLTHFKDEPKVIHSLEKDFIVSNDLVFLAAEKSVNKELGLLAKKQKSFRAVDLSETFNNEEKIPIIVDGVNDKIIEKNKPVLVANPHPVTIILSHFHHLILKESKIVKSLSFVLQPISVYEDMGIKELADQSFSLLSSGSVSKKEFKEQIAFNLLLRIGPSDKDGFDFKEQQIVSEIRRVLNNRQFPISLSIIQVPVFHAYSIKVFLELSDDIEIPRLEKLFINSPLFKLSKRSLPSPVSAAGEEQIHIGNIKKEVNIPRSYWIWMTADNLVLGSAMNAYEIGLKMISVP